MKYTGTQKGVLFGIEPINQKIEYSGSAVFTFQNGKIIDVWVLGDIYGYIQQLQRKVIISNCITKRMIL